MSGGVAGVFASQTDCLPGNPPGTCNFSGSYINLRSPSGGQSVGGSFTTRLSGDTLDGLYQATITLPAYSEQGTWTVDPVHSVAGFAARQLGDVVHFHGKVRVGFSVVARQRVRHGDQVKLVAAQMKPARARIQAGDQRQPQSCVTPL